MTWEWILGVWTCIGIAWWFVAFILVVSARNQRRRTGEVDPRRITVFKPLPRHLSDREFARFDSSIESFIADLDENSELLIGCHRPDQARLEGFVERMSNKYPEAQVKLVAHDNPNRYPHPKVSWMHVLAPHAKGELWLWSDSDMRAPPGTIRSMRADLAATRARCLTSPYVIEQAGSAAEMLDLLYVNLEFYPGVVFLGGQNMIRFGLGSGMLFGAEDFKRTVDWDYLGGCLAEDFHLGGMLTPAQLGSMRLTTVPASRDWKEAILHYLRWQKNIRWCRPGPFGAQLVVMPLLGCLAWVLVNPAQSLPWMGLLGVLAADAIAALSICRVVGCRIGWKRLPTIPLWSFIRGLSWVACWFPWPIVWRGQKWWSPHQEVKARAEALETQRQSGLD
jgi:ceramide glucosyltransferase